MDSTILHTFRIAAPGVAKKRIFHFSDIHLTVWDALSDENERAYAEKRSRDWDKGRIQFADGYHEPHTPAQEIPQPEHLRRLLAKSREGDALVLTGDILENVSGANIREYRRQLTGYPVPLVSVRGNHEKDALPEDMPGGMAKPVQVLDLGDLQILGIDDARMDISDAQLAAVEKALSAGKPTLAALHAPFTTPLCQKALAELDPYYMLNHEGCPKNNPELIRMLLAPSSPVLGVLSGHLHFQCVVPLTETVTLYGASQGMLGHIHEYCIGE